VSWLKLFLLSFLPGLCPSLCTIYRLYCADREGWAKGLLGNVPSLQRRWRENRGDIKVLLKAVYSRPGPWGAGGAGREAVQANSILCRLTLRCLSPERRKPSRERSVLLLGSGCCQQPRRLPAAHCLQPWRGRFASSSVAGCCPLLSRPESGRAGERGSGFHALLCPHPTCKPLPASDLRAGLELVRGEGVPSLLLLPVGFWGSPCLPDGAAALFP